MKTSHHAIALVFLAMHGIITSVAAQDELSIDALLKKHTYELNHDKNQLSGEGLTFLLRATKESQFICFSEPHNAAVI